jgi:putative FmdB family regulatory protein
MAWYEYECKKCGTIQTKVHKMADKNTEKCENEECKATPKHLQKLLSRPTHHGHATWSRWKV